MTKDFIIKKYRTINPNSKWSDLRPMSKEKLVRLVQQAEGNETCFKSSKSSVCNQTHCLWYKDCVK